MWACPYASFLLFKRNRFLSNAAHFIFSALLGLTDDIGGMELLDGLPFTTLLYANGAGGLSLGATRQNLTGVDTADVDYIQQALVPLDDETHGGEDVPIYASGPMAHLLHGVHEQNYIAHVMAYASCVGANKNHCDRAPVSGSVGLAIGHVNTALVVAWLIKVLLK